MYVVSVLIEHNVYELARPYDYLFNEKIELDVRVIVPFGNQRLVGYVVDCRLKEKDEEFEFEMKEIIEIIDEKPLLNKELNILANYMSERLLTPKIRCLQSMLPPSLKPSKTAKKTELKERYIKLIDYNYIGTNKQNELIEQLKINEGYQSFKKLETTIGVVNTLIKKEVIENVYEIVSRTPYNDIIEDEDFLVLNEEQKNVFNRIKENINQNKIFLLHGITGSGKTEVYLHSTRVVLENDKQIIVLVPEISLTPQMVERYKKRFGKIVAVLHSRLSMGEKHDEYLRIVSGEVKIVVGARSAIFSPLNNIGLIIIDEEHDKSYKQESMPKYHARDIALWRASYHNCPVILGSATPSIETYARTINKKYILLELLNRTNNKPLPRVELINMLNYPSLIITKPLINQIDIRLRKKEQIVLLVNKRGFSSYVQCLDCGYVVKCPSCSVNLVYHHHDYKLKCHYCGYETKVINTCSNCGGHELTKYGVGIQKIEQELNNLFPYAKVLRMDHDTTRQKNGYDKILNAFANQKADILLGTQMVSKGLDFPNVTLVGVMNADATLNSGDFRASEMMFQLLVQICGRSGRDDKEGMALIQTSRPEHFAVQCAKHYQYLNFFNQEMAYRQTLNLPPFINIVGLLMESNSQEVLYAEAMQVKDYLNKYLDDSFQILGPAFANIEKLKNKYRMRFFIKYTKEKDLFSILNDIIYNLSIKQKSSMLVDINPYDMV